MEKQKRVLVHACCGPCLSGTAEMLEQEGLEFEAYWYNPNIHPYREYKARLHALERYAMLKGISVHYNNEYDIVTFLNRITTIRLNGGNMCTYCYGKRLKTTALAAKALGFEYFTTTMLISPHQDHETIRAIGKGIGKSVGLDFLYMDFRKNYKRSIEVSREMELYRQGYCGCVISEWERYSEGYYVPKIY